MSFKGINMTPLGGNSRAGQDTSRNAPMAWAYQSLTDDRLTVQSVGYFDSFSNYLAAGQFIYASLTDGKVFFTIQSVDRSLKQVFIDTAFFSPSANPLGPSVKLDSDAMPGQLFAISGFDQLSDLSKVDLADNDVQGTLRPSIGVAFLPSSEDSIVRLLLTGEVSGLDTAAFGIGDRLYLISGGGFSNVSPEDWSQDVGYVTKKDAVNGRVFFDLSPRTELLVTNAFIITGNRTVKASL